MALVERLNLEIKEAIKSRNQLRLNTLRMLKAKILAVNARGEIPDAEAIKLFKTYLGNLQEAVEGAVSGGRHEMVVTLKEELAIVQEFLPQSPSLEETRKIVQQAIAETGAKTKKELGLVMKGIMKLNSTVDGKMAKELASEMLSD